RGGVPGDPGRRAGSAAAGKRSLRSRVVRLSLTDRAAKAVLARAREADVRGWLLRVAVVAGGCNGLTYELYFVQNPGPEDAVVDAGELRIALDPASAPPLAGTALGLP